MPHRKLSFLLILLSGFSLVGALAEPPKPYVHWRMENNGQDMMGHQNLLELNHTTFSNDSVEGSYSLSFDNHKNAHAIISKSFSISTPTSHNFIHFPFSKRTLSLWFKTRLNSIPPKEVQYLLKIGALNGFTLFLKDQMLFAGVSSNFDQSNNQLSNYLTIQAPFTPQKWHHITIRFHEGKFSLFLNGVKQGTKTLASIQLQRNILGSSLGSTYDGYFDVLTGINHKTSTAPSFFFHGLIDDVQIYTLALSDEDIINLSEHKMPLGQYDQASYDSSHLETVPSRSKPIKLTAPKKPKSAPIKLTTPKKPKPTKEVKISAVSKKARSNEITSIENSTTEDFLIKAEPNQTFEPAKKDSSLKILLLAIFAIIIGITIITAAIILMTHKKTT